LTVDLGALIDNLRSVGARVPGAEVAPVVKADAYGLGAGPVVRSLATHGGVGTFFTATVAEALAVREAAGREETIVYTLNGYQRSADRHYDSRIRPVVNTPEDAADYGPSGRPFGLAIDIGMNRLGLASDEAARLADQADFGPRQAEVVVMHLSHGSEPAAPENAAQFAAFETIRRELQPLFPNARFSLSASAGAFLDLRAEETLIRPGVALYGGAADGVADHALRTVATFEAPVLQLRDIPAGSAVGYNGRWRSRDGAHIAILGAGYADGYRRSLGNKGVVWLGGAECPVVGAISMDLIAVDISHAPDAIACGDRAELFGDRIRIDRLAGLAGTIAYELLVGVGPRVARDYVGVDGRSAP
jgi:alanine racemase